MKKIIIITSIFIFTFTNSFAELTKNEKLYLKDISGEWTNVSDLIQINFVKEPYFFIVSNSELRLIVKITEVNVNKNFVSFDAVEGAIKFRIRKVVRENGFVLSLTHPNGTEILNYIGDLISFEPTPPYHPYEREK